MLFESDIAAIFLVFQAYFKKKKLENLIIGAGDQEIRKKLFLEPNYVKT